MPAENGALFARIEHAGDYERWIGEINSAGYQVDAVYDHNGGFPYPGKGYDGQAVIVINPVDYESHRKLDDFILGNGWQRYTGLLLPQLQSITIAKTHDPKVWNFADLFSGFEVLANEFQFLGIAANQNARGGLEFVIRTQTPGETLSDLGVKLPEFDYVIGSHKLYLPVS